MSQGAKQYASRSPRPVLKDRLPSKTATGLFENGLPERKHQQERHVPSETIKQTFARPL